jgi:hypothetical protein
MPEAYKPRKVVLVSSCGLWGMDNFDPLLVHVKAFCKHLVAEFAGALLRPHANMLSDMVEMGVPMDDVFESAKEAGRQLVANGTRSTEALRIVGRELMPRDTYVQELNRYAEQELDKLVEK